MCSPLSVRYVAIAVTAVIIKHRLRVTINSDLLWGFNIFLKQSFIMTTVKTTTKNRTKKAWVGGGGGGGGGRRNSHTELDFFVWSNTWGLSNCVKLKGGVYWGGGGGGPYM